MASDEDKPRSSGPIKVRASVRRLKSGKVVNVKAHTTKQRDEKAEALKTEGRVPVVAQVGQFAGGRSTPGSKAVHEAEMRLMDEKIKRLKQRKAAKPTGTRLDEAEREPVDEDDPFDRDADEDSPKAKKPTGTRDDQNPKAKTEEDEPVKKIKKPTGTRAGRSFGLSRADAVHAAEEDLMLALSGDVLELAGKQRRVRTPEGSKRYNLPIGSIIIRSPGGKIKVLKRGSGKVFGGGDGAGGQGGAPTVKAEKGEFSGAGSAAGGKVGTDAPKIGTSTKGAKSTAKKAVKSKRSDAVQEAAEKAGLKTPDRGRERNAKHFAELDKRIEEVLQNGGDTQARYATKNSDGKAIYSAERAALHKEIINDVIKEALAKGAKKEHRALISGGLPGAGKTTVLEKFAGIPTNEFISLNPDDFKEHLIERGGPVPGTEDGTFSPMEMAAILHEESSDLNKKAIEVVESQGFNVIHDITLGGNESKHAKSIQRMKDRGYEVGGVFVDIEMATSDRRAAARYERGREQHQNGEGLGGRYVPAHVAAGNASSKGSWSANRDNFEAVRGNLDGFYVYDNNTDGGTPTRVEQGGSIEDIITRSRSKRPDTGPDADDEQGGSIEEIAARSKRKRETTDA